MKHKIQIAFPQWKGEMNAWGNSMLDAVQILSEMLAIGFGMPKETFRDMTKDGPHLLAPTGSDLNKYGDVGRVLAGFHT
jgi:isopenicillin N synthase-like dioxygenase